MKIITETRTTVSIIALTKKEIETLVSAQKILDDLWSKLEEADTLETVAQKIYNNIEEVGFCLDNIATLVDIEE